MIESLKGNNDQFDIINCIIFYLKNQILLINIHKNKSQKLDNLEIIRRIITVVRISESISKLSKYS